MGLVEEHEEVSMTHDTAWGGGPIGRPTWVLRGPFGCVRQVRARARVAER